MPLSGSLRSPSPGRIISEKRPAADAGRRDAGEIHLQGSTTVANILTSWKEIGQYLGKGVRTVQRWEREAGLPVRRQAKLSRHAILAMPDELDTWVRSRTRGPSGALAGALQREITSLRAENDETRARLDVLEATMAAVASAGVVNGSTVACGSLRRESERIRHAAQQCRAEAIRARLSLASTLCAVGEQRFHDGDPGALRRAQHSLRQIGKNLESPGYVPPDELEELRCSLRRLVLRIESLAREAGGKSDSAAVRPMNAGFVN